MYMFTLNVELFWSLFVFGIRVQDPVASVGHLAFLSLTGGTPHFVRQTPPVGRSEKARRHSPELNGPRTRTPPTDVITAWQAKPDLKTINFNEKDFPIK
ncbi:MAG: hypothetical protein ACLUN1_01035 [Odoribacter splanchnicus]